MARIDALPPDAARPCLAIQLIVAAMGAVWPAHGDELSQAGRGGAKGARA